MATMRTYSLHITFRVIFLVFLAIMTEKAITMEGINQFAIISNLILCAGLWYFCCTTAYKVSFDSHGVISAISLIRKFTFNKEDIKSVSDGSICITVRTSCGTVRIASMLDGVGNVASLFGYTEKEEPIWTESDNARWFTPKLGLIVILILAVPLLIFWDALDPSIRDTQTRWSNYFMRQEIELLLDARFSPLEYLNTIGVLLASVLDMILLIILKSLNIPLPALDSIKAIEGGDHKKIRTRIFIVWGLVILHLLINAGSLLGGRGIFLFCATIASSYFLYTTVSYIFRMLSNRAQHGDKLA